MRNGFCFKQREFRQDQQDYQDKAAFGRRPYRHRRKDPHDPVNPVQEKTKKELSGRSCRTRIKSKYGMDPLLWVLFF